VVVEEMLTAGYIILTLLVAVLFYWLRCRHRFAFGCVEIVVAVVVITFTFVPQTDYLLLNGPSSILGHLLSEAAGLSRRLYLCARDGQYRTGLAGRLAAHVAPGFWCRSWLSQRQASAIR
jgi:hypothetical protein